MIVRVGINGFGRIGRLVFRALHEQVGPRAALQVVAVNDLVAADNLAYLLKFDSVQGRFKAAISSRRSSAQSSQDDILVVDDSQIQVLGESQGPAAIPWPDVDIVIEATGLFTSAEKARGHLSAGAKKVIITAPASGEDITVVMGVNDEGLDMNRHHIISNASCTTNCLAPLVHVLLREGIGLEEGLMTTVHSYTASQKTVDAPSRKDWRGGRAAAVNIIPSATGAARAVGLVCPEVKGKLTGMAFRVPTPAVSVVDLTLRTGRASSLAEINGLMKTAAASYLQGILGYTEEQVVSSDFVHDRLSSIYDAGSSIELNSRFFKLISWYDNEWAYACRVADLASKVAGLLA
ncbi:MAG: type I glyceraldehyde-3-phosphate dehydrogenase [Pseudomonadales bacterium]|nr:type I glyceraldehyde-3-phosphate dehydrogenase [Pseudomonadales bacterium]